MQNLLQNLRHQKLVNGNDFQIISFLSSLQLLLEYKEGRDFQGIINNTTLSFC